MGVTVDRKISLLNLFERATSSRPWSSSGRYPYPQTVFLIPRLCPSHSLMTGVERSPTGQKVPNVRRFQPLTVGDKVHARWVQNGSLYGAKVERIDQQKATVLVQWDDGDTVVWGRFIEVGGNLISDQQYFGMISGVGNSCLGRLSGTVRRLRDTCPLHLVGKRNPPCPDLLIFGDQIQMRDSRVSVLLPTSPLRGPVGSRTGSLLCQRIQSSPSLDVSKAAVL